MSKVYQCSTISLTFEIYFLVFPWGIVFGFISSNYLHLEFLGNVKWTVIYLKLFWYKVFVHSKLKLLDFLSDFVLMSTACVKTPYISLSCKLVPVPYRTYRYGPLRPSISTSRDSHIGSQQYLVTVSRVTEITSSFQ